MEDIGRIHKDNCFTDQFITILNLPLIFDFSAVSRTDQVAKEGFSNTEGDLVVPKSEIGSYHL